MAVLPHEGTFSIMYGTQAVPVGASYRPGYFSRPDEAGRFPVVLVIPGLAGLSSGEKSLARALARNGLAAVVVELFSVAGENALDSYSATSDREALVMLEEAYDYLVSDDVFWALPERVGLLGIDVGGRPALTAAATRPWVGSVAVVSTPLTGDEGREHHVADYLGSLPVAVLGLYGEADELIDNSTVDEAQSRNDHGLWLLYEGAGHEFWNEESSAYDSGAGVDMVARLIEFYRATLPVAITEDLG
ncbi:MAG: dienelactone hydrolase family protein [Acidimicrobiia bacterium]